jgi:UDP-glucose:(heptosyl)LPS alpha-1,3-glucosyltransferase
MIDMQGVPRGVMKPLRLAIIRQRYTPFGGAERFIDNALKALRERGGLEVTVITREWKGAAAQEAAAPNVVVCAPFYLGRVWRLWAFARAACTAVREGGYDLVQSHERLSCCDIFRAGDGVHREWLRQRDRILSPWRRWLTRLSPFHRLILWQERRMFLSPRLKVVIANSEMVKRDILRHYPETQARIEVIYNGVDSERFNPRLRDEYRVMMRERLGIAIDAQVLLFVGSGYQRKGVDTLLQVMQGLPDACHLVIVGKDSHQRDYERRAVRLAIAQRVHFMGPQTDVRPYYGMADLFVFPTLYDPFPNAVIEAMACGLPVIVSDTCGTADLISDGVFDALAVSVWRDHVLSTLKQNRDGAVGHQSRQVAASLSLEQMATAMATLYDRFVPHRCEDG